MVPSLLELGSVCPAEWDQAIQGKVPRCHYLLDLKVIQGNSTVEIDYEHMFFGLEKEYHKIDQFKQQRFEDLTPKIL